MRIPFPFWDTLADTVANWLDERPRLALVVRAAIVLVIVAAVVWIVLQFV